MKISLKTFLPVSMIGALSLTSCYDPVNSLTHIYCSENNKTVKDYYNIVNEENLTTKMSKLDSMAYRDIFESTRLAKDSNAVAEFNSIADFYRSNKESEEDTKAFQEETAIEEGMLFKDYNEMIHSASAYLRQHIFDRFAYQKFFQTKGIYDDSVKTKFDKYSDDINRSLKAAR